MSYMNWQQEWFTVRKLTQTWISKTLFSQNSASVSSTLELGLEHFYMEATAVSLDSSNRLEQPANSATEKATPRFDVTNKSQVYLDI